jgi:hypothetical protein
VSEELGVHGNLSILQFRTATRIGVAALCFGACRPAPPDAAARQVRAHTAAMQPPTLADAAALWVRAHASVMLPNAESLRACMGETLPADPAHAPSLSLAV